MFCPDAVVLCAPPPHAHMLWHLVVLDILAFISMLFSGTLEDHRNKEASRKESKSIPLRCPLLVMLVWKQLSGALLSVTFQRSSSCWS